MPQILIRQLNTAIVRKLRARAAAEGVSAEEEARRILRRSLVGDVPSMPLIDFLRTMPDVDDDTIFRRRNARHEDRAMNGFLLDTNVVSELRKEERCAPKVNAWAATVLRNQDFLSVLVVGELMRGAVLRRRADPQSADALEKWIAQLAHLYTERILPVTLEIAQEWAG